MEEEISSKRKRCVPFLARVTVRGVFSTTRKSLSCFGSRRHIGALQTTTRSPCKALAETCQNLRRKNPGCAGGGGCSLGFPSIAGCPKLSEFQKGRSISIAKPSVVKTHGNLRVLYPPRIRPHQGIIQGP